MEGIVCGCAGEQRHWERAQQTEWGADDVHTELSQTFDGSLVLFLFPDFTIHFSFLQFHILSIPVSF